MNTISTAGPVLPGRRFSARLAARVAAVAVAATAVFGIQASPASAADRNCTRVTAGGTDTVNKYILAKGWGWTAWNASLTINAYDRCNHGALSVTASTRHRAVAIKGGQMAIGVAYQRSGSSAWYRLPYNSRYDVREYLGFWIGTKVTGSTVTSNSGPHLDMTRSTRITKVRVTTTVIGKQDGSNDVPLAGGTAVFTCNLLTRTCSD